ncbi:hypothetical protein [Actinomadura kijaniata]|uniref:hypothetical protein n=1 Tax=Actinomadura kijaniata TaxID=46161 RepID=UPI000A7B0400|nr:hypothetical protein [Actinomadura kijaniata]
MGLPVRQGRGGGGRYRPAQISTRPELDKTHTLARELRASGVAVALVIHEHKRLGRGVELAAWPSSRAPTASPWSS